MKLNQYYVIGNLVRDAETKIMSNGKPKQVFTLAVNDDYKKAGTDEWIKRPYFLNCYVVGKEYQNLLKGKKVMINGKVVTKNYEHNGAKKTITLVEVFALDYIVMKDNSDYENIPAKTTEEKSIDEMDDTDLPF